MDESKDRREHYFSATSMVRDWAVIVRLLSRGNRIFVTRHGKPFARIFPHGDDFGNIRPFDKKKIKSDPQQIDMPGLEADPYVRTKAPEDLSKEERTRLLIWCREHLPHLVPEIRKHVNAMLDHHRAKGSMHLDWEAAARNWLRRVDKYEPTPMVRRRDGTMGQNHEPTREGMQALGKVLGDMRRPPSGKGS